MNCERFQTISVDLTRSEVRNRRHAGAAFEADRHRDELTAELATVEADERANALRHIDECEGCAQAWSEQRTLSEGLHTFAEHTQSWKAPAHLEEKLLLAFRDRQQLRPQGAAVQHWRYWATAVAATLLIVFGLLTWRWHAGSLLRAEPQVSAKGFGPQSQSPTPDQSPSAVNTPNQTPQVIAFNSDSGRRIAKSHQTKHNLGAIPPTRLAATKPPAASNEPTEVATDFVVMGYGSALDLQDGGQLVRVELPRSALARFGLPMNMDRANERVKADVLLGTDGLARAIRFVK
jgi:hypothetical protein